MLSSGSSIDSVHSAERRVLRVLEANLSPIMAKCVLSFALSTVKTDLDALRPEAVEGLLRELARGVRLYAPDKSDDCMGALRPVVESLAGLPASHRVSSIREKAARPAHGTVQIPILSEADIVTARHAGRKMCSALGFSRTEEVKAATVISELARNIVQYAKRGHITLRHWSDGERVGIEIHAKDEGPGIPHLETILAGRYRSKTGLGLGITGTRKLAHSFEINSAIGRGTQVIARMVVR